MDYNIDIILCIDVCSSLNEVIERFSKSFWNDYSEALNASSKIVTSTRIKVITFGCALDDNNNVVNVSRWYNISNQNTFEPEYFSARLKRIKCIQKTGASRALEALSIAIKQDWIQEGDRKRHIICMITNNQSLSLDNLTFDSNRNEIITSHSLEELSELWMASYTQSDDKVLLHQSAKRLVIYAPQVYPWLDIYEAWDQVIYNPINQSELCFITMDDIINSIISSV